MDAVILRPGDVTLAEWLAARTGGYAQSMVLEAWANIPTTAHILGGAVIAATPGDGVVDTQHFAAHIDRCSIGHGGDTEQGQYPSLRCGGCRTAPLF